MKRIFNLRSVVCCTLLAASVMITTTSCKEPGTDVPEPKEYEMTVKTELINTGEVESKWTNGDQLGMFMGDEMYNVKFDVVTSTIDNNKADFKASLEEEPKGMATYHAYYPYTENISENDEIEFKLTDQQYKTGTEILNGVPAYASSTGEADDLIFKFKSIYSLVKVPVSTTNQRVGVVLNSITFSGNNEEKVAGNFVLRLTDDGFDVRFKNTDSKETVSLTFGEDGFALDEGTDYEFYIAVAPGEYKDGYTITFETNEGEVKLESSETIKLEAGQMITSEKKSYYCIIPDPVFRRILADKGDVILINDETGEVELTPNIETYVTFTLQKDWGIMDLRGIEYFKNLEKLNTEGSALEQLDLSHNLKLQHLRVRSSTALNKLLLPQTEVLEEVFCEYTAIDELDISGCTGLTNFSAVNTKIGAEGSIDFSHCPNLIYLDVNGCSFTSLDVSNSPLLVTLYCNSNNIGTLNLNNCRNLKYLSATGCGLNELDLSNCTELIEVKLDTNDIETLDITNLTKLDILKIENNKLSAIDLRNCPGLSEFRAAYNELKHVDCSKNTQIRWLSINNNPLEYVNISNCNGLATFYLFEGANSISGLQIVLVRSAQLVNTTLHTFIADNIDKYTTVNAGVLMPGKGATALKELSLQNCKDLNSVLANNCPALENIYLYGSSPSSIQAGGSVNKIYTEKEW